VRLVVLKNGIPDAKCLAGRVAAAGMPRYSFKSGRGGC